MTRPTEHDVVRLTQPAEAWPTGTEGTVVSGFATAALVEVEAADEHDGATLILVPVEALEVLWVSPVGERAPRSAQRRHDDQMWARYTEQLKPEALLVFMRERGGVVAVGGREAITADAVRDHTEEFNEFWDAVLARWSQTRPRRPWSLDEVLQEFGYTREQLGENL